MVHVNRESVLSESVLTKFNCISFQPLCLCPACSISYHIFSLCQLTTLTIHNSLSLSLLAQDLPLYRQHCAQRKATVFNLLRGRFWLLYRRGWNFFHPRRCNSKGIGPQNWNFYWDFIKMWNIDAPQGRIPCTIFTKFAEFVPHFSVRC